MRMTVVILFVVLIAAATIASPAKNAPPPSSCARICLQNYEPVCGKAKNGSKERLLTFGNSCVMENYNCEHSSDPYEKKSSGECGNKVSVRLQ